ncbi:MAG: sigma-54 dependent transcriptional regulator, partial [Pseudomonadota bacterium]|nr:sigma-54 dependent transcriptional regulator [Pseudomonadota bacterium]
MAEDILIVDDEADIRLLLAGLLSDEGYEPRQAANDRETFAAIARRRPALVILDIWLKNSEMDGLGILAQIKKDHPDLPVLMMSGHGTIETAVAAIKKGAHDFIEKPFKADRLVFRVERAIEAAQLKRENADLRDRLELAAEVVGQSPMMNQLLTAIGKVATTNSRVLITGPAGAGQEVAARLLHERSARHGGPLVILNSAILDPARLEIELFGREGDGREGGRVTGTFERAHNGTLFLDEVADMPMETQGKIVRVLQEQQFRCVDGQAVVEVDVRVIASTTRDLQREIAAGRFREDLYYRLNVVPLRVPYLHERRADIPALIDHFLERAARA